MRSTAPVHPAACREHPPLNTPTFYTLNPKSLAGQAGWGFPVGPVLVRGKAGNNSPMHPIRFRFRVGVWGLGFRAWALKI